VPQYSEVTCNYSLINCDKIGETGAFMTTIQLEIPDETARLLNSLSQMKLSK
jgi:hypothetical protein